jgi:hypothetical protein
VRKLDLWGAYKILVKILVSLGFEAVNTVFGGGWCTGLTYRTNLGESTAKNNVKMRHRFQRESWKYILLDFAKPCF